MDTHANDREVLRQLLQDMEYAMLTTRAPDGSLVGRPLQVLQMDAQCRLWFFTSGTSGKVDDIAHDAQVNLAFADVRRKRFVSVSGYAEFSRDRAKIAQLWSAEQTIFFPQGRDDPALTLLCVTPTLAHHWDGHESAWGLIKKFGKAVFKHQASDLGREREFDLGR